MGSFSYLELKNELENEGIYVDLDSARRSVADQQRIMDEFTEEYGADYARKTVAEPGYSEHHTGLALDLYLIIDGKDVVENEDMMQYTETDENEKICDNGIRSSYDYYPSCRKRNGRGIRIQSGGQGL